MKVYAALFNPMIEESCFGIISLHLTKSGADLAIKNHKCKKRREEMPWIIESKRDKKEWKKWFAWKIIEYEILN